MCRKDWQVLFDVMGRKLLHETDPVDLLRLCAIGVLIAESVFDAIYDSVDKINNFVYKLSMDSKEFKRF